MLKGKGIFTPLQREALHILAGMPDIRHLYPTGGTALAEFYLREIMEQILDKGELP